MGLTITPMAMIITTVVLSSACVIKIVYSGVLQVHTQSIRVIKINVLKD